MQKSNTSKRDVGLILVFEEYGTLNERRGGCTSQQGGTQRRETVCFFYLCQSKKMSSCSSVCSFNRHLSMFCSPARWWTSSLSSIRALRLSRNWTALTPRWWHIITDALPR